MELTIGKLEQFISDYYADLNKDRPTVECVLLKMAQQALNKNTDSLMTVAVMLKGALLWTARMGAIWYKSKSSWLAEYGLSRRSVDKGNAVLEKLGWEVDKKARDANLTVTHYRLINPAAFVEALAAAVGCAVDRVLTFFEGEIVQNSDEPVQNSEPIPFQLPRMGMTFDRSVHSDCTDRAERLTGAVNNIIKTYTETKEQHIEQEQHDDVFLIDAQSGDKSLKKQKLRDAGVTENRVEEFALYPLERIEAVINASEGKNNPGGWIASALAYNWNVEPVPVNVIPVSAWQKTRVEMDYTPGMYDSFVNS